MSTRANIKIKEGENVSYMYCHCDGYPEGLGKSIIKMLSCINPHEYWTIQLITDRFKADMPWIEETGGVHGDEEYQYVIDTDERILECIGIRTGTSIYKLDYPEEKVPVNDRTVTDSLYNLVKKFSILKTE